MRSESATIKPITRVADDGLTADDKNETVARIGDLSHWVSTEEGESRDKKLIDMGKVELDKYTS